MRPEFFGLGNWLQFDYSVARRVEVSVMNDILGLSSDQLVFVKIDGLLMVRDLVVQRRKSIHVSDRQKAGIIEENNQF